MARKTPPNPSIKLLQNLIQMEEAGIPLDDFTSALIEMSLVDRFTGMEIQEIFAESSQSVYGLHGVDHTVRVIFWIMYLVEISNRSGYPISEEEALAAVFAGLVHDLSRTDDLKGGMHGEMASQQFEHYLQEQLSPEMLARCLTAVRWHGYSQEPQEYDPVWVLLKDADALDRARFAAPGTSEGCDPARLRLAVLKENTPLLDGCLTNSMILPVLISMTSPERAVFRVMADGLIQQLLIDSLTEDEAIQQAARLISDRYNAWQ